MDFKSAIIENNINEASTDKIIKEWLRLLFEDDDPFSNYDDSTAEMMTEYYDDLIEAYAKAKGLKYTEDTAVKIAKEMIEESKKLLYKLIK